MISALSRMSRRERPILMNGEMVRRVLDGSKTQTRRPIDGTETIASFGYPCGGGPDVFGNHRQHRAPEPDEFHYHDENGFNHGMLTCKQGIVGDRLWVREAWRTPINLDGKRAIGIASAATEAGYKSAWCPVEYMADGQRRDWDAGVWPKEAGKGRPSIHMPRWASRITLEIASVRVERVQSITEEDARAEGVRVSDAATAKQNAVDVHGMTPHRSAFACLWESLYPGTWKANAWVWVISFKHTTEEGQRV